MRQKLLAIAILIVTIILIIIFIIHMLRVKRVPKKGGRVLVHESYEVSVNYKTHNNPNYGKGSDLCFYLNNLEAPTLILKKGVYYEFHNKSNEPLYFSSDSKGGLGAPGSISTGNTDFTGLSDGVIYFLIDDDLPNTFYYQSGKHNYMGGKIEVVIQDET